MSAGNPNLAEQVVELQATVAALQQDVDDTRRQSNKVCVVFHGAALAQHWGESEFDTLQRVVWEGWSRTLVYWEIEDCHALSKQDGQPRFIASFRDRKMYSNFWFILNHPPTGPGIHASRHLTAKTDLRMKFIARVMERRGEIHSYWFNWRSGKLQCQLPNGRVRTYQNPQALLAAASPAVRQEVEAKDRARSRRQRRR